MDNVTTVFNFDFYNTKGPLPPEINIAFYPDSYQNLVKIHIVFSGLAEINAGCLMSEFLPSGGTTD